MTLGFWDILEPFLRSRRVAGVGLGGKVDRAIGGDARLPDRLARDVDRIGQPLRLAPSRAYAIDSQRGLITTREQLIEAGYFGRKAILAENSNHEAKQIEKRSASELLWSGQARS
jgi:hypothetical protein